MKLEEISLTIDVYTSSTLPMSRLAEYLKPFALMLGSEANVHFKKVADGSAVCQGFVDAPAAPKVRERIQGVVSHNAPRIAMKAYSEIDDLLVKDNAIGHVTMDGHNVIEFPGRRRAAQETIGPVRRSSSIDGQIFSVGGKDDTINVHLMNGEQEIRCVVSVPLARRLGSHLLGGKVRLFGSGLWFRVDGVWQMKNFVADDFVELNDSPLMTTVACMRRAFEGVSPDEFMSTVSELRNE